MALEITLFTDPACPFAFSAEPVRQRLRWHYGDQLRWRLRMIVLTLEPGEDAKLAEGAPGLQRKYGMPIDPNPYPRTFSSEPACRAVVAARLNAPGAEAALLRRLRVRAMVGGLLDDPALLAAAATRHRSRRDELSALVGDPRGRGRAARGHRSRPRPLARRPRAGPQARRPAPRAPLHRAELRAQRERAHVHDPRLQPGRGLRDRAGQLRADAPGEARVGRAVADLGERAAGHGRGRRDHAGRSGQGARRAGRARRRRSPRAPTSTGRGVDVASPRGDGLDHPVLPWAAPDRRGAPPGDGLQRPRRLPARATATCCWRSRAPRAARCEVRLTDGLGGPAAPAVFDAGRATARDARSTRTARTCSRLRDLPGEYSFATLFSQPLDVGVRLMRDGAPVAEADVRLEVYDVAQLGSLYERIVEQLVIPDTERQAPGPLARLPPVVPGAADRRPQGRAVHARAGRRHRPQAPQPRRPRAGSCASASTSSC